MCLVLVSSLVTFTVLVYYLLRKYRKQYISGYASKRVFITGTDSGFGLQLALNLDKKGVKVYAGCYTEEGAEHLRQTASKNLKTIRIDITDIDSVIHAKDEIEKDLQSGEELWGLVNNAGMFWGYTFCVSTREVYRRVMEVNFFGTINVTDTFMPLIKKSAGRIVNVISMAGRCSGGFEPYTCSKHALEPYSDGLRRWLKRYGVHVAIIEPGAFKFTKLFNNSWLEDDIDKAYDKLPQHLREEYGEEVLKEMKRNVVDLFRNPTFAQFNTPAMITNAINSALFSTHPKVRYVCGLEAKYLMRFTTFLPDFIQDFVAYRFFPYYQVPLPRRTKS